MVTEFVYSLHIWASGSVSQSTWPTMLGLILRWRISIGICQRGKDLTLSVTPVPDYMTAQSTHVGRLEQTVLTLAQMLFETYLHISGWPCSTTNLNFVPDYLANK